MGCKVSRALRTPCHIYEAIEWLLRRSIDLFIYLFIYTDGDDDVGDFGSIWSSSTHAHPHCLFLHRCWTDRRSYWTDNQGNLFGYMTRCLWADHRKTSM